MQFGSLQMGAYGGYVWSSYGLALLILAWVAVGARRSWLRELKQARRRMQAAQPQAGQS
jgi:heme exporter protein CcmD